MITRDIYQLERSWVVFEDLDNLRLQLHFLGFKRMARCMAHGLISPAMS